MACTFDQNGGKADSQILQAHMKVANFDTQKDKLGGTPAKGCCIVRTTSGQGRPDYVSVSFADTQVEFTKQ